MGKERDVNSFIPIFVGMLICGGIAAAIGSAKNHSMLGSFLFGFFLGLIGIFIVWAQPKEPPKPPPGMQVVQCPRCNAVQNVPLGLATFECFQCKVASNLADAGFATGRRGLDGPEDAREWFNRVKKQP
jgi:hypothetical protein